jgi:hypothetical protein
MNKERSEDFKRAVSGRVIVSLRFELGEEHESRSLAGILYFLVDS